MSSHSWENHSGGYVMSSHGLENDSGGFCREFPWLENTSGGFSYDFFRVGLRPENPQNKTPRIVKISQKIRKPPEPPEVKTTRKGNFSEKPPEFNNNHQKFFSTPFEGKQNQNTLF